MSDIGNIFFVNVGIQKCNEKLWSSQKFLHACYPTFLLQLMNQSNETVRLTAQV
jgi:hypothetical protein